MKNQNWPAADGYEQLAAILQAAHDEAAYGKGKERHANDLPFHGQRMQTISGLVGGTQGMAFQAIKKLTEGLQFDDHERRERELLGAINYLAGIVIFYRNNAEYPASTPADWDAAEERMDAIGRNGNGGEHYP